MWFCYFTTNSPFVDWPPLHSEIQAAGGNHIGLLALAWSYVLSARWIELQKPTARLYYAAHRASIRQKEEDTIDGALEIAVHQGTGQSTRWWAALLASGRGWHAEINHDGKLYKSPRSAHIADSTYMLVRCTTDAEQVVTDRTSEELPPSFKEALAYLHDYCEQHSMFLQYTPALAAAMVFPWKNENNASAILPMPRPCRSTTGLKRLPLDVTDLGGCLDSQFHRLRFYMTLSCNIKGLRALLAGSFFYPNRPCNLVGPWMQPAFEVIDPLLDRGDSISLAAILARR